LEKAIELATAPRRWLLYKSLQFGRIHSPYIVAGFIHIVIRNDFVEGADSGKTAYLEGIFVKPAYKNKGIATLLFSHGEQWAKSSGLKQLASDTEIRNEISQRFHKKIEFDEVNRIVYFLKNI
jgi:aminoglycoside 6'-N-acetyltransferase I